MAEVGSAFVSLVPSARGFGSKMQSEVGGEVDGAGKSLGSRFGTVFKVGALAAVGGAALLGNFLKGAVGDASDLSESMSKVGVVFGSSSGQIVKASKSAATSMGLTQSAYLGATGTLGNLLVSLDLAPKKAANMSQEMVKLAGDMASFNNVPIEDALAALQSGLTGETEPLKRFGVNMNEATLKTQALKMGLIETTTGALDPQTKALAAQALIMDQTKTAQGDFARTSGGLANQQRILTAQFGDMKATIGAALLPVVTSFVTFLNSSLIPALGSAWSFIQTNVVPVLLQVKVAVASFLAGMQSGTGVGGSFAAAFRTVADALQSVYGFVRSNLDFFVPFVAVILSAVAVAKTIAVVTKLWAVAQGILNVALAANPIGIVVVALAALAAALVVAYKRSETFRDIVNGAWNAIKATVTTVANAVRTAVTVAWNAIKAATTAAWNAIKNTVLVPLRLILAAVQGDTGKMRGIISEAWAFVKSATTAAWNAIKSAVANGIGAVLGQVRELPGKIKAGLGNLGTLLYSAGRDLIQGMINGVRDMVGSLVSAAGDVVGSAINAAKSKLGINSPSKVFLEIGHQTGEGLRLGLADMQGPVERQMARLAIPGPAVARASVSHGNVSGSGGDMGAKLDRVATILERMPKAYQLGARQGAF